MSYAKWVKDARTKAGKSQEQLAAALGLTKGNVSAWENSRHNPRLEQIYAISRLTGHPLPTEVQHIAPAPSGWDEGVYVPLLANAASMGIGEDVADYDVVQGSITLTPRFISDRLHPSRPDALRFIHAHGDSMEPTFQSGDILLVDSGIREVKVDGVYVLQAHDRLFVKRVRQRMDGSLEVSSDNPTHKTVDVLNGESLVTVLGRVLWVWNGHKM